MKVRIKKLHKDAVIPRYARQGDAGMDLVATSVSTDEIGNIVYGSGLAFEIPEGYVGLLFPRSSISRTNLLLTNSVGVLDSGYRGEVMFKFKPTSKEDYLHYGIGERIGQIIIVPYPHIEFVVSEELTETERGTGGYGSTGK